MGWLKQQEVVTSAFACCVMVLSSTTFSEARTHQNQEVIKTTATNAWHLVWHDEFDGKAGSPPNSTKWTYDIGRGPNGDGWGNQELEYYTDSTKNAFIDGHGHLVIRAIKEDYEGQPYTSARLVSHNSGNWKYGKVEVRAKLPAGGTGIWPAIWMLPTDWVYGGWPVSGEIDMMEMIGEDPLTVYGTIHFGNPWKYVNASYKLPDAGFHTYSLEWDPDTIKWFVDGHLYETRTSREWYSSGGKSPAPFDQRFHLLMNLAVGGNWPQYPDDSVKFPQQMVVDYVRVYQKKKP